MYSLQTRDPAEAKRLAAQHTVGTDNQFQAARASIEKPAVAPKREPVILREYVLDPDTRDSLPSGQKILFDPANPGDHVEVTLAGEPVALLCEDAALGRAGASISKSYKRQLKDARSFKTGLLVARALDAGRPSSQATPEMSTRARAPRREVTRMDASAHLKNLQHVVPSWIARNAPKQTSIRYARKAIALFEEAVGVIPLRELTKAHGAAFVRFLLDSEARGFKNKTAGNHAASITALLNVAVKDDLIERNPLDLTFDKTVGAEKREPWTATELDALSQSVCYVIENFNGSSEALRIPNRPACGIQLSPNALMMMVKQCFLACCRSVWLTIEQSLNLVKGCDHSFVNIDSFVPVLSRLDLSIQRINPFGYLLRGRR